MGQRRKISTVSRSIPTVEGAGVHLKRAFGFSGENPFDPFLLLDDFRSDNPREYAKGFPWHPHRGIETISYVLAGSVEHMDSMGNKGEIGPGDVQWMTAGSGIIHQEMPKGDASGTMGGFQLWSNLPASHKMMDPRYQEVKSGEIPEIMTESGVRIRIICGEAEGIPGPVTDIVSEPSYLDVTVPPDTLWVHQTKRGHTLFAFVFQGSGIFAAEEDGASSLPQEENPPPGGKMPATDGTLLLFSDGDELAVSTGDLSVRFLLISGKPIGEPVAWYGPVVMNTQEELRIAFQELQDGTFVKTGSGRS